MVRIAWDTENNYREDNDQLVKRNLQTNIIICQQFDMDGYGTIFPTLPPLSRFPVDTNLLWILSVLLTRVKKLWMLNDQCEMKQ